MKMTIGIPTYNRLETVKKMAKSLEKVEGIKNVNIRIYDDKSPNLSLEMIKELFPFAKEIRVREKNLGADGNMYQMYKDFLETDDEIFLNLDSDFIINNQLINAVMNVLKYTDGVISVYNSNNHSFDSKRSLGDYILLNKNSLGAAGTVFKRSILEKIIKNVKPSNKYDWDWSKFLVDKNIDLLVFENSLIQHIGFNGQNTKGLSNIDYGRGFNSSNFEDQKLLIKIIENLIIDYSDIKDSKKIFIYSKKIFYQYLPNSIKKFWKERKRNAN